MLVETQIRFALPDLAPEKLDEVVVQACAAMALARGELREHVSLLETTVLGCGCIAFRVRGLCSHAEKEYLYNLRTRELFGYNAACAHLDIGTARYLRRGGKLDENPGF